VYRQCRRGRRGSGAGRRQQQGGLFLGGCSQLAVRCVRACVRACKFHVSPRCARRARLLEGGETSVACRSTWRVQLKASDSRRRVVKQNGAMCGFRQGCRRAGVRERGVQATRVNGGQESDPDIPAQSRRRRNGFLLPEGEGQDEGEKQPAQRTSISSVAAWKVTLPQSPRPPSQRCQEPRCSKTARL
jgi:hypothetical protein